MLAVAVVHRLQLHRPAAASTADRQQNRRAVVTVSAKHSDGCTMCTPKGPPFATPCFLLPILSPGTPARAALPLAVVCGLLLLFSALPGPIFLFSILALKPCARPAVFKSAASAAFPEGFSAVIKSAATAASPDPEKIVKNKGNWLLGP